MMMTLMMNMAKKVSIFSDYSDEIFYFHTHKKFLYKLDMSYSCKPSRPPFSKIGISYKVKKEAVQAAPF